MAVLIQIEADSSRDDLLEALANYNAEAKRITRRGLGAQSSRRYVDLHDTIDALAEAIHQRDSIPA